MKFSDIAIAAESADNALTQAHVALSQSQDADLAAHDALVSALKLQTPAKAAIVDPSGVISVFRLDSDGTGYIVEVYPGDFDVPDVDPVVIPDPTPSPDPEPAPEPAPEPTPEPTPVDPDASPEPSPASPASPASPDPLDAVHAVDQAVS